MAQANLDQQSCGVRVSLPHNATAPPAPPAPVQPGAEPTQGTKSAENIRFLLLVVAVPAEPAEPAQCVTPEPVPGDAPIPTSSFAARLLQQ